MVYIVGITSPITTAFFKNLGANDFHFGLLGGLPIFMLSMQFFGALICNRVIRRKWLFIFLVIFGRLLYLPMAFAPLLYPELDYARFLIFAIFLKAMSSGLGNLTGPLWFSWMADVIPRRILNHYWGTRQSWLHFTWTLSFLLVMLFTYRDNLDPVRVFPIVAGTGVVAGIIDILLFIWVKEPENTVIKGVSFFKIFMEPLRHKKFRSFILYSCAWAASAMCAAVFMQVYVIKVLEVEVWKTSMIWCLMGVMIGLSSRRWGKATDKHGSRPIIVFCTFFKPLVCLVFIFLTRENVLWLLPLAFLVDPVFNAGILVASNGYMLKIAPRENRSMFIASITALSGICGGTSAILGGIFLKNTESFSLSIAGINWFNYRLLFAASFILRICSGFLAFRIKEPESSSHQVLLNEMLGTGTLRFLRFPIGLYRKARKL